MLYQNNDKVKDHLQDVSDVKKKKKRVDMCLVAITIIIIIIITFF